MWREPLGFDCGPIYVYDALDLIDPLQFIFLGEFSAVKKSFYVVVIVLSLVLSKKVG